jgi:hypothetical protein
MGEHVSENVETVFWINRYSRSATSKILEAAGVKKPDEQPFHTYIPIEEIASLEDEALRDALNRQLKDREENAPLLAIPVAYMPERTFSHGWLVPRKPMFSEEDIQAANDDHEG